MSWQQEHGKVALVLRKHLRTPIQDCLWEGCRPLHIPVHRDLVLNYSGFPTVFMPLN